MEAPFTDDEKRFILAELIKDSKADMQPLVDFVKAHCRTYSWFSVQLPTGRNLNQCVQTTQKMLGTKVPAESLRHVPPTRPQPPAPSPVNHAANPASAPSISTLLSAPAAPRATTPHRPIQPRPVNGASRLPPASPGEPPAKKPRGRPPRRQNLRCGSNPSPRPLPPLAPQPPVELGPVPGPAPDKDEPRGQKRGRESSDEAVPSFSVKPCPADAVKEIKAEGSGATPPTCSESDGAEDKTGAPARVSPL